MYIYIYIHIHIYTYTYIHVHTYTYIWMEGARAQGESADIARARAPRAPGSVSRLRTPGYIANARENQPGFIPPYPEKVIRPEKVMRPNLRRLGRTRRPTRSPRQVSFHPGGGPGANLESIFHRCHPIMVAFVWELPKETINSPLGYLQGGFDPALRHPREYVYLYIYISCMSVYKHI